MDTLAQVVEASGLRALELVIRYILHIDDEAPDPEVLQQLRDRLGASRLEAAMGYADRIQEEALQRGRSQGLEQGLRRTLLRLLDHRFGPISNEVASRLARADAHTLERWVDRALVASSLDEVFAG